MTETNANNDGAALQGRQDAAAHRGFSPKVRGVLLESQLPTSNKLPVNISIINYNKIP